MPDAPDSSDPGHTHLFMTTDTDAADIRARAEDIRGEHPYRRPCQLCWTPVDLMPAARARRDAPPRRRRRPARSDPPWWPEQAR